eukprot:3016_1
MSFGNDFEQSPMNSFHFKKGHQSNLTTPIKTTNPISATPLYSNNEENNMNRNNNDRKATKYDYLDYGNYLNRMLSSQCLLETGTHEINWNFPRTADKVNAINAVLAIFESKKLYQTLLEQARDTIENMKIEIHSNEMKLKSVHQKNKELNGRMNSIYQRKEYLEKELKKQTHSLKEKNKSLTKEIEQLRYRDKKYQNDIRKKEKIYKSQQEKIKKLLDERDKKSYKCLGFKLLNNQIPTSVLSHPSSLNASKNFSGKHGSGNANVEQQNRLLDENNMLQSQIAHFQKQLQSVLGENNLLRESLLKLEVNCKDALMKINDLFANNSNNIQSIHSYKYAMPFDKDTQNLVNNDIEESVTHLLSVLDELKLNIDQTNNTENIQKMKSEIIRLKTNVQELEESNKEYETLIRTYVNSG